MSIDELIIELEKAEKGTNDLSFLVGKALKLIPEDAILDIGFECGEAGWKLPAVDRISKWIDEFYDKYNEPPDLEDYPKELKIESPIYGSFQWYTQSIDAAITLAKENYRWGISVGITTNFLATIIHKDNVYKSGGYDIWFGEATTPALAICMAALDQYAKEFT